MFIGFSGCSESSDKQHAGIETGSIAETTQTELAQGGRHASDSVGQTEDQQARSAGEGEQDEEDGSALTHRAIALRLRPSKEQCRAEAEQAKTETGNSEEEEDKERDDRVLSQVEASYHEEGQEREEDYEWGVYDYEEKRKYARAPTNAEVLHCSPNHYSTKMTA